MPGDKTRDLRKMGRRNFLETLAGIGVSSSALKYMTKDRLEQITDDPTDKVPILAYLRHKNHEKFIDNINGSDSVAPKREPVYETIDRHKWLAIKAIRNIAERLNSQLPSGVRAGVGNDISGSKVTKVVKVQYRVMVNEGGTVISEPTVGLQEIKNSIPNKVTESAGQGKHKRTFEDIPVRIEKLQLSNTAYYDKEYRPVPAGAAYEIADGDGDSTPDCTLGTPTYDIDRGEWVWVTAAHCVGKGEGVYQNDPNSAEFIGRAANDDWDYDGKGFFDACVVKKDGSGVSLKYDIASNGWFSDYEGWPIKGIVARDRLEANEDKQTLTLYRQGSCSGRDSAYPTYVGSDTITIDIPSCGGDSGGPIFEIVDGDAYIAAITNSTDGNGTIGTAMYEAEDRFNLNT